MIHEEAEPEFFDVEKILEHKKVGGVLRFKNQWRGYPVDESTWEGVESFLSGLNEVWKKY